VRPHTAHSLQRVVDEVESIEEHESPSPIIDDASPQGITLDVGTSASQSLDDIEKHARRFSALVKTNSGKSADWQYFGKYDSKFVSGVDHLVVCILCRDASPQHGYN
jgi:hypothetical protein